MTTASAIAVVVAEPTTTRQTFGEAAEENLDGVFRYLSRLVGDRDLAEDLTSATFERALKDWHRFDPAKGTAGIWLIQVARRVALDHFRSEGRRRAREERYAAGEELVTPAPEVPVGDARLRAALDGLTRAERELIALRVVLEMDSEQTATIVGGSPSAVSSGLHRALGKLRTKVGDIDDLA